MYRAKGEVLKAAWPRLSDTEKNSVMIDIANAVKKMAALTSETYRGIGGGMRDVAYMSTATWDRTQHPLSPRAHLKYTAEELDKRVDEFWDTIRTNPRCKKFIFFPGDLSPGNIFVGATGSGSKARLTEIIDFEFSGFHPSWYPLINFRGRDYHLETENYQEYAVGLCHYVSQHPGDFPDEVEWRQARTAADNGYAKIQGRLMAEFKEYKELHKQKNKAIQVARRTNDEKPWWEWDCE